MIKEETFERLKKFRDDRDWKQFHTGENLAKSLMIEAGELLEVFQWSDKEKSLDKVKEELADVFNYCFQLAIKLNVDPKEIILNFHYDLLQNLERANDTFINHLNFAKSKSSHLYFCK